MNTQDALAAAAFDLRAVTLRERRDRIFSTFRELAAGQTLHLVDDQDLEPVYYEFQVEMPRAFHWEYLEAGPEIWRADVTRLGRLVGSPAWPLQA